MKKKTIGIIGPSQIYHLIPVLEQQYNIVNIQKVIDSNRNVFVQILNYMIAIMRVDIIYNVYTSPFSYRKLRIAHLMRKKIVTHWIGTDVRLLMEGKTDIKKLSFINKHVVCFEPLQDDLRTKGIDADILPITPFNLQFEIARMPKDHAVIIYMPQGVEMDYGLDQIERVFPKYPQLPFYIVANDDKERFKAFGNVHVLGRLTKDEMENLYNKVSIVIRIHHSDGLSMSILEGMAKGKKIIWNCKYPLCHPGSTTEEICRSLDELLKETPQADKEAHDFIVKEYTREKFLQMFNYSIINI